MKQACCAGSIASVRHCSAYSEVSEDKAQAPSSSSSTTWRPLSIASASKAFESTCAICCKRSTAYISSSPLAMAILLLMMCVRFVDLQEKTGSELAQNVSWAYLPPFAGLEPDSATDLLLRTSGLPAPASAASNSITEMFTVLGYHPLSIVLTASRCRKRGRFDDALAELEKDSKAILLRSVKEGNRFDSLQACLELSYNSPRLSVRRHSIVRAARSIVIDAQDTGRALFRGIAYLGQPVKPDDLPVLFRSLVNVAKATEKLRSIALSNKRVTIAPGSRLSICSLRSDATLFTRYPPMESLATCGSQQAEEILPALLTSKKAIFIIAKRVRQRIAEVVRRLSCAVSLQLV